MIDMGKLGPSNSVRIWMPVYIGDYLADTIGFSHSEHGAYFLAMMAYWRKGEALTERELRAASGRDFQRISDFFILCDGLWHHKRLDIELAKANAHTDRMKEIAQKSVASRRASGLLPKSNAR